MKNGRESRPPSDQSIQVAPRGGPLAAGLQAGLLLLLQAWDYAHELAMPVWEFAVAIPRLWAAGVSANDLRWLAQKACIEHAPETTPPLGQAGRTFQPNGVLTLTETSCVVLTASGAAAVRSVLGADNHPPSCPSPKNGHKPKDEGPIPCWDAIRRQLRVRDQIVKRFLQPAECQVIILAAFEEDGWAPFIDDPLPQQFECGPKQRLNKTIEKLNRNHEVGLLRFIGDGTGERVGWKWSNGVGGRAAVERR